MKKIFSILSAAALVFAAASCQKTPDAAPLEISAYTLAESASFGETVDFTVTAAEAANVTAALIKDGYVHEQVISHKEKYISLTGEGKEIYAEFINKSAALTQKLRSLKKGNSN